MVNKLDLSLDSIIKLNKKGKTTSSGRGKRQSDRLRGTGSGVARTRNKRGKGRGKAGGERQVLLIESRATKPHKATSTTNKKQSGVNKDNDSVNKKSRNIDSGKLLVTNLDFKVSDDDIRELFSECGPLQRSAVHFSYKGKSLGSAEVHFKKKASATTALEKYNGASLDGRPMQISFIPSSTASKVEVNQQKNQKISKITVTKTSGNQQKVTSVGLVASRRGRGKTRGQRGRQTKKGISAEELDKQLNQYISKFGK